MVLTESSFQPTLVVFNPHEDDESRMEPHFMVEGSTAFVTVSQHLCDGDDAIDTPLNPRIRFVSNPDQLADFWWPRERRTWVVVIHRHANPPRMSTQPRLPRRSAFEPTE